MTLLLALNKQMERWCWIKYI